MLSPEESLGSPQDTNQRRLNNLEHPKLRFVPTYPVIETMSSEADEAAYSSF